MKKRDFQFLSADKKTKIHAVKWEPDGKELKGILQISHGMVEYVERYEKFAEFMVQQGFLVAGNDHLGHGKSVTSESQWGYFAPKNGSDIVVEDIDHLRRMMETEHPGIPYFILGHSMGSFLLRKYLSQHGSGLKGAIIMGTGTHPNAALALGKGLCRCLALFRGWDHRSNLLEQAAMGGYNKKFKGGGALNSWLTKDKEIVAAYSKEPRCSFKFTVNGYYTIFDTIHYINRPENIGKIPKNLPLLFVAGEDDPVGNYGKGVKSVCGTYKKAGITDITCRLYPGDRHEILNELDKEKVYKDIFKWIKAKM